MTSCGNSCSTMFISHRVRTPEKGKACHIVEYLYKYFIGSPEKMPELYVGFAKEYGLERAVCDFISGMTDDFAVDYFKELCIPKSWSY